AEPQPAYNYGVAKKITMTETPAKTAETPKPAAAQEPAAEKIKIVEVPVEKIVIKEVPKVVEVERVVFPSVAFRFDSAELTELGKGEVYLAAQRLKEKSDITIAIEGHTDNAGTDEYNQKLGMRRAETVMNELVALGIERARMSTVSLGAPPGGLLQVAARVVGPHGKVIGVDLQAIDGFREGNIMLLQGDITADDTERKIKKLMGGPPHCVISDLAPRLSGICDADT